MPESLATIRTSLHKREIHFMGHFPYFLCYNWGVLCHSRGESIAHVKTLLVHAEIHQLWCAALKRDDKTHVELPLGSLESQAMGCNMGMTV